MLEIYESSDGTGIVSMTVDKLIQIVWNVLVKVKRRESYCNNNDKRL